MHSGIPYTVSNIVLVILWMIAANLILDSRYSKKKTILIESLIQITIWLLFEKVFPIFSGIRYLVGIGSLILIIQFFHTDKWTFKLITVILIYVAMVFSEVLLGSILPYDLINSGEIFEQHGAAVYSVYIFFNLMFLTPVVIALRSYKRRYQGLLPEKEWLLFAVFPFNQGIFVWGWFNAYKQVNTFGNTGVIITLLAISLLADAALIYMIRSASSQAELRIRSEMLEEQIRSQGNYYSELASTYTDIRKMRHDIDNHIFAIQSLLDDGETGLAKDYIHQLAEKKTPVIRFADCRNTVVSSYLESRFRDITGKDIQLETDLHLPASLSISDPDLICIFGNLLDNALEACRDTEQPSITLKTKYQDAYLSIICSNTFSPSVQKKSRRIPELERGVGFTILNSLAKQYDGQFVTHTSDNIFHAEMILKAEQL